MRALRSLWRRTRGLFGKRLPQEEIDAELLSHLEMHYEDNLKAGMGPEEAKRHALIRLGGLDPTRQLYRERLTLPTVEAIWQDLRFSFRQLRKNPGFTITALGVFALSVSAAIAIAALVDSILIKPLPYERPDRLVALFERVPAGDRYHLSFDDFVDWKKENHEFSGLEVYRPFRVIIKEDSVPHPVDSAMVSAGFFSTLGVKPILGRTFDPSDDDASGQRSVLLSNALWRGSFRSDPKVIGKPLRVDGDLYTITGVLPRDFHFAPVKSAEIWQSLHGTCAGNRDCHPFYGIGRLKDGSSLQTVEADLRPIARRIADAYPLSNRDRSVSALPLTDLILGGIRPVLLTLQAGAALLLLIGVVNVFNLLLVRADTRLHETAIRSALGASRFRLFRQFACEGFLLALAGSALGLFSGTLLLRVFASQLPANIVDRMPYLGHLHVSSRVFLFSAVVTVLSGLIFTLAPLPQLRSARTTRGVGAAGRSGDGTRWGRIGAALVVTELLITVVLLVSAGLLTKSAYLFLRQNLGFSPQDVAVLHVFSQSDLSDKASVTLARNVLSQVAHLPGVDAVAISGTPVLNSAESYRMLFTPFKVVGRAYVGLGNEALNQAAGFSYFQTLHARLLMGRYFSESDSSSMPSVAIVNQEFVRVNFPGESPIGKRIQSHYDSGHPIEIVGVLADMKDGGLGTPATPTVYRPFEQLPSGDFYLTIRTPAGDELLTTIATLLRQTDPDLIVADGQTLGIAMRTSEPAYLYRLTAVIAGCSAAAALALGAVGLYGLISYSVGRRAREIGIRMALGAQRSTVYRFVLQEGLWLTGFGITGGMLCSFMASHLLRTMIYHVSPWDPFTLLAVTFVLTATSLAASFFPARRAASIDPNTAFRNE